MKKLTSSFSILLTAYISIIFTAAAQSVSVDLGQDYFTVPANKSTVITSTVTGNVASYAWVQISGPNTATLSGKNSATLTASNLIVDETYAGQNRPEGYIFRLTVTDVNGNSGYDEITVKLAHPNLGTNIQPYAYTKKTTGWDTSPYLSYQYGLPFRILYPRDYKSRDDGKRYPLILAIHGRGEQGTDNDYQLKIGGKKHLDAVTSGNFDGFVVFPQYIRSNNLPATADLDNMTKIINELIIREKVDPNRIHIHGLSSGGKGVWDMIVKYPKVYASAIVMSWSEEQYRYPDKLKMYIHLPLWVSQGGKDTGPPPDRTNDLVKRIRDAGANVRYLYFPNNGHNTWDATYNQPNFFSFFMERNKTDIHVFYGQTSFCEGDDINVKLGLTAGFADYEWQKDGVTMGTGVNEITVTEVGHYRVRFKRGTVWTAWSKPVHINRQRAPSPTPVVTTRKKSTHLPSLDGNEEVTLYATEGNAQYFWFKNGQLIENANKAVLTVSEAGFYTVTAIEPDPVPNNLIPDEYRVEKARCESLPSARVVVTTKSGPNAPKAPTNLFAFIRSATSVELKFDDHANNENGFEIYRSNQSGGPYTIIDIIPANTAANPASFIDLNLKGGTEYFYKIRAVNDDGASSPSNEAKAITPVDNVSPSVPQNLRVGQSTLSSITLKWDASTDNVGVTEYLIYQDGVLIATSQQPEYIASGLSAESVHTYTVRAKDAAGNISSPSNQVTGAAIQSGLIYTYYHVSGISTVNDIVTKGTKIKTGRISNFLLDPREQETSYAFIYEGFIHIETAGDYTFYLKSDDGSRLYVNNQLVVNHDGGHSCTEKSSTVTLAKGTYPIKVDFFQGGGGACLEVRWSSATINKQLIPDGVLRDAFDFPEGPQAPASLQVAAVSYKTINLNWQDQSTDETGFEIYRATSAGGPFHLIHTTEPQVTTFADTTLTGNTTYYFKIRAISGQGASSYTEVKSAKTLAAPTAPAKPTNLKATAVNSSSIRLEWTDASSNETGFEIWRTTSPSGNGFALLHTVAANETSYLDLALPGNTALYYRIRAKGDGGYSAYTAVVSATTSNNAPVLQDILSRTVKFNTTLSFDIFVQEQDASDIVSFEVTGLPAFGSFVNNNDHTGTFTFSPSESDGGSYHLQVKALDNHGGVSSKNFTITVNNNATPAMAAIENQQVNQGASLSINVSATDEDGTASLQLSLVNHPDFVTITDHGNGQGVIKITPGINETPGEFSNIQVVAKDQQGGVGVNTFDLTVKGIDKDFTVYINFSHGNLAAFPWNNTGDAKNENNVLGKITDEEGKKTGMSLQLRQDSNPAWFSKRTSIESDLYTADVRDTRYSSFSSPIVMTMSGLNPLLSYNFTFFGSSNEPDSYNRTRITRYTIGNKSGEIETFNNESKTVNLTNVKPDANGNVQITVNRKSSNDWIIVLNAMVVEGFYDNGSIPAAPSDLSAQALSPSEVQLTWLDHAKSEEGYEILRATNSNGPFMVVATTQSNSGSFVDQNLSGRVTYFYKVRAFNTYGVSAESNIATVITPNNAPVLSVPAYAVVEVGSSKSISISATDAENDPLRLQANNLPSFAHFIDHEDGTAAIIVTPGSLKNVGSYSISITALDDRNDGDKKEMVLMVISNEYDDAVYINFNHDSEAGVPWNNTNRGPVSSQIYTGLKDAKGNTSATSFTVLSGWSGAENFGVNTNNNSGVYPDDVIKSYWKTSSTAELKLSGLSPDKLYNFIFFASNDTIAEGTTLFTMGTTTTSLNAAYNSQRTTSLNGIVSDVNGEVTVSISKGPYAHAGYLGAMIIQAYEKQILPSPSNLVAQAVSRTQIKLTWLDNAGNETGYNIYRSASPYGSYNLVSTLGSNATTYTDQNLTKNTTYYYKVQAVKDAVVSEYSNTSSATTFEYLIYINFVGNDSKYSYPVGIWNHTRTSPYSGGMFRNLKDDAGTSKAVQIYVEEWPSDAGDNNLGISTGNNSGIYPDAILKSFYFLEKNTTAKFEVQQLDPHYQYSFIFLGSGDPNIDLFKTSGNLTTDYTVGQKTVTLNALGNKSETVQINSIIPNENNAVPFEITSHRFTEQYSANYSIFNTMVIGAYTPSAIIVDELAPSTPTNLAASKIDPNRITLTWSPSTDNSGAIASYEIYNNNEWVATVHGGTTTSVITNTVPDHVYNFSVIAVDEAGNKSQASEVLSFSYEVFNGLNYAYYEGEWNSMPDFTALPPVKTGFVDNFSLTPKLRNRDFGFRYYGYIKITNPGNYTFFTRSNTGSKLYIDGVEIVNNDYANDSAEKSGTAFNLTSGWHEIVVDYRNAQETDLLEVWYEGPGVAKMRIPDQVLFRTAVVSPVSQPVEFVQVKAEIISQEVVVSWSTASENNNDYFMVERSYDLDNFAPIGLVKGAGNSHEMRYYSFIDNQIRPGNIYYRIRQTDFDGKENYSKVVTINSSAIFKLTEVILFPNPTSRNNIHVKVISLDYHSPVQVSIIDMVGRIAFQEFLGADELFDGKRVEPRQTLKAGTYLVKFEQGEQILYSRLIIQE